MAVTRSIIRSRLAMFAASVLTTLTVVNGWRPLSRRGGRRAMPLFLSGLVATEAPLPLGAFHALIGLRLARRTRGAGRWAILALAITGLSASAEQYRRARIARVEIPRAVRRDLGDSTHEPIETAIDGVTPRPIRAPWPLLHRAYTSPETRGVVYGPHGVHNTLDVWRRPDVPGRTPVLIQIHGGGWTVGDNRTQGVPLMAHMAEAGWTCVAPRYRLSPRATWPDHLDDVHRAIAWVRSDIERFGGDPSFIALTGGSAGGHLAALAGLTSDPPIQAVVPFYGIYDWVDDARADNPAVHHLLEHYVVKKSRDSAREVFREASPIEHVNEQAPPFFVLHGTNDSLLHVGPARMFVERLREVSTQSVVHVELPLAQHAFDLFRTPRAIGTCEAVGIFLSTVYQRPGRGDSPNDE